MTVSAETFDHYDPSLAEDPYPALRELRERCPVGRSKRYGGFFFLTRYRDVYDAAHDFETFSSARGHITIPSPDVPEVAGISNAPPIETDPPEHHKYRALVAPFFSPQRIGSMEPSIRTLATALIDRFIERGEADLAQEFAFPMPMYVICRILGVEESRWKEFREWINRMLQIGENPSDALEAAALVGGHLLQVLESRRAAPADDLITYLVQAEVDGDRMTPNELLGFSILLFGAGAETTTNAIGNSLAWLGSNPDQRRRLIQDPRLLPNAVEEFLRFDTPVFGLARTVTKDTQFRDCPMSEGDRLLLLWGAANHDPEEFENPDEVDIERSPNRHLAFGAGIHRCLGSHLARAELRIALQEILRRMPEFKIADTGEVERCVGATRGVRSLPVVFRASSRESPGS